MAGPTQPLSLDIPFLSESHAPPFNAAPRGGILVTTNDQH
jgi:hypothetical protein